MFVDASALVAILTSEREYAALTEQVEGSDRAITSALAIFETVAAVCRKRSVAVEIAERDVLEFLRAASIEIVPIGSDEGRAALTAFARFGKGQGHPAQLNMGDCFAYACARTHAVPLLFVGNDFPQTDIAAALA